MENPKIVVSDIRDIEQLLKPINQKLDTIIEYFRAGDSSIAKKVYNNAEAVEYLKISVKKLQNLRNGQQIGFVRGNGERRVLLKHEHLVKYLLANELKRKR